MAYDANTGHLFWQVKVDGAVGWAPAVINGFIYFGSVYDNIDALSNSAAVPATPVTMNAPNTDFIVPVQQQGRRLIEEIIPVLHPGAAPPPMPTPARGVG